MNPKFGRSQERLIVYLVVALVSASCAGPRIQVLERPAQASKTAYTLVDPDTLTSETRDTLRAEGLQELYIEDPDDAIRSLSKRMEQESGTARRQALAEICVDIGGRLALEQPNDAIGHYLDAARITEAAALLSASDRRETPERLLYDHSAVQIARLLRKEGVDADAPITARGAVQTYRLRVSNGFDKVSPVGFDAIVPTHWLKSKGIDWKPVTQDGFGAAMAGHKEKTSERKVADPIMPEAGHGYSLNASLRFSGENATLVLQDLMRSAQATINGHTVPLAADFTTPLDFLYQGGEKSINKILATLRPGKYERTIRLYSLEPFRDDKIPLILVHGLVSTAEGWLPFINELRADPLVREHYQIIAFNYPTGNSIARNAAELRRALVEFRDVYDPRRSNPRMRDMVILGHSMGGVISNLQIRDSGSELYDLAFTRPIEELGLDPKTEREIRKLIFFKPNPDIGRAVLIAAPLRGSSFASNRIGQIGASLIRLPFDVVRNVAGEVELRGAITDEARPSLMKRSNSVNSLRPDNPFLSAFLKLPVRTGVSMHSIMAQTDRSVPKEEGTDGLVFHTSAHLDGVASEKIVLGAGHGSVLLRGECFQEIWRILHLHNSQWTGERLDNSLQ